MNPLSDDVEDLRRFAAVGHSQRTEQFAPGIGNLVYRPVKRLLIGFGRFPVPADLSNELKRGVFELVTRGYSPSRLSQLFDVSTHGGG